MPALPLKPLIVFGTRPELIKLAPLIEHCRDRASDFAPVVCCTGQHQQMIAPLLEYFDVTIDRHLDVMRPGQSLAALTSRVLTFLDETLADAACDCVVVQGDTTTAMAAGLTAFYRRLPVIHVEAGLRTGDLFAPWPEEMNRRVLGTFAALHCAATDRAASVLAREGVPPPNIRVTGNTVVDTLLTTLKRETADDSRWPGKYAFLGDDRTVLITCHRRESFGPGIADVCDAIAELARRFGDVHFVYPVHKNPAVLEPVQARLRGHANVHLIEPATYPEFVWLMQRSRLLLSDSGGVQEEAPSLGKPVVVMRDCTERQEAVEAGAVKLVGTDRGRIVAAVSELLTSDSAYQAMVVRENPFGDGRAARRIADAMVETFAN